MKKILIVLIGVILCSCQDYQPSDDEIVFGQNNVFHLDTLEGQKDIDSSTVLSNDMIHGRLGKVQFPLNKVVSHKDYEVLICIALPSDNMKLILDQTNSSKSILDVKENTFLQKMDSLYIVKRFFTCENEEYVYEFNYINKDSSQAKVVYDSINGFVDSRIECK